MLKILLITIILYQNIAIAEDEPGGWVEPGGYDPIAEERQKNSRLQREADERLKAFNESQKKAAIKRAADARDRAIKQKQHEQNMLKPENMAKNSDAVVCARTGDELRAGKKDDWQNEMKRRSLSLKPANAKARSFNIGSTECEVFASLGVPTKVNRTVRKDYVRKQIIYSGVYVYTENNIVTSWQD